MLNTTFERTHSGKYCLDLLGTPAGNLSLAHVGGGLDRGNELEANVGETDDTNDTTSNLAEDHVTEDQAADEDVDCPRGSVK